jgi:hypothetical protein
MVVAVGVSIGRLKGTSALMTAQVLRGHGSPVPACQTARSARPDPVRRGTWRRGSAAYAAEIASPIARTIAKSPMQNPATRNAGRFPIGHAEHSFLALLHQNLLPSGKATEGADGFIYDGPFNSEVQRADFWR